VLETRQTGLQGSWRGGRGVGSLARGSREVGGRSGEGPFTKGTQVRRKKRGDEEIRLGLNLEKGRASVGKGDGDHVEIKNASTVKGDVGG